MKRHVGQLQELRGRALKAQGLFERKRQAMQERQHYATKAGKLVDRVGLRPLGFSCAGSWASFRWLTWTLSAV